MPALIFPLRISTVQVSLRHETMQRYSACLLSAFFQDMRRRIHPSDRHILWRCKGHTEGIGNLFFRKRKILMRSDTKLLQPFASWSNSL